MLTYGKWSVLAPFANDKYFPNCEVGLDFFPFPYLNVSPNPPYTFRTLKTNTFHRPCCEVAAHELLTSSEGSCIAQRGEQSLPVSFGVRLSTLIMHRASLLTRCRAWAAQFLIALIAVACDLLSLFHQSLQPAGWGLEKVIDARC